MPTHKTTSYLSTPAVFLFTHFLFAISASSQMPAQSAANSRIEGKVIDAMTQKPLVGAKVALHYAMGGKKFYHIQTDAQGVFRIHDIPPNEYILAASRNLYTTQEYGAGPMGRPGLRLVLANGLILNNLSLPLMPHSVISGKILNSQGLAGAGASVFCEQPLMINGKTEHRLIAKATSNDLGEYRFFGLPPGTYLISSVEADGWQSNDRSGSSLTTGPLKTYWGSTSDPERARTLFLPPGQELRDVNIQLSVGESRRIQGTVTVANGISAARALVMIRRLRNDLVESATPIGVSPAGRFESPSLPPGTYSLSGYLIDNGSPFTGKSIVEVTNSIGHNIELVLQSPITVTGRMITSGKSGDFTGATVVLVSEARMPIAMPPAFVPVDGSFSIPNVAPDRYSLKVLGLPSNFFVKSISNDGIDITDKIFDISKPIDSLFIQISQDGARVHGEIANSSDPLRSVVVILSPVEPRQELWHLYKTITTNQQGKFELGGVEPGKYRMNAFYNTRGLEYESANFLQGYKEQGKLIEIRGGESYHIGLVAVDVLKSAESSAPLLSWIAGGVALSVVGAFGILQGWKRLACI